MSKTIKNFRESNKDRYRHDRRSWYIGFVENISDPDKRRRIQVRFAHEQDIPSESLRWCQPIILSPADFRLPNEGEPIFVLRFDDLYVYLELPNMIDWSKLSDDDYPTAEMHKHKDVYEYQFTKSEGFKIIMAAVTNAIIKNYEVHIDENIMHMYFESFGFRQTNQFLELGNLEGGDARMTIDAGSGETVFNDNKLGSYLTDINKLVAKINRIEQQINMYRDAMSAWVPVPFDGGAALKIAATGWISDPIIETEVDDIKDPLLKN